MISQKHKNIVEDFLKKVSNNKLNHNSKFAVVHWRRGDQLTSRCKLTHNDQEYVYDFSVNCESVYDFLKIMKKLQLSLDFPIFIASNEKIKKTINIIEKSGFKLINNELSKLYNQLKLTTADYFIIELYMMFIADSLYGSGI